MDILATQRVRESQSKRTQMVATPPTVSTSRVGTASAQRCDENPFGDFFPGFVEIRPEGNASLLSLDILTLLVALGHCPEDIEPEFYGLILDLNEIRNPNLINPERSLFLPTRLSFEQFRERFRSREQQTQYYRSRRDGYELSCCSSNSVDESAFKDIEGKAKEAVNEAMGDGARAQQTMSATLELDHHSLKADTELERAALAQEAPALAEELAYLTERFSLSKSRWEHELLRLEIRALAESAPSVLEDYLRPVSHKLEKMFSKTFQAWERREKASKLRPVKARELQRERRRRRKRGQTQPTSELVQEESRKRVYYKHDADLAQRVGNVLRS